MEERNRLHQFARDRLKPIRVVLASGPGLGGAERSLLESLPEGSAFFLVPAIGSLSKAAEDRGHLVAALPLPDFLLRLTHRRGLGQFATAFPLLWQLPAHLFKLHREFSGFTEIASLGIKSHFRCLFLAPLLRNRLGFDIRDFLPLPLRLAIGITQRLFGCRVQANSKAVGRAYPTVTVIYPNPRLPRPPEPKQKPGPPWIVVHAAFFAPYKGQDLFLEIAAEWLATGVDAEFWLIGDVAYPAPEYQEYAEKLRARVAREDLRGRVRLIGRVEDVQPYLEQVHLLLHCTREPEPFGRVILEALQCGCEVVCHRGSGACEVLETGGEFPEWMKRLQGLIGKEYARVSRR